MAEEKKPESTSTTSDPLTEIISVFFIFFLLSAILNSVASLLNFDRLFSGGLKSFTKKELILKNTRPLASTLNKINSQVLVSSKKAFLYADDLVVKNGSQNFGSEGKIIKGPISFLGSSFFFVDFFKGKDGFVKEDELSYVENSRGFLENVFLIFYKMLDFFWYFLIFLCVALLSIIINLKLKTNKIIKNTKEKLFPSVIEEKAVKSQNPKWEKVLTHVESTNSSDWRLAIIEADILLSELLETMSLVGDSIGDKLKSVEKSDFTTLDLAWEAHKIRNKVAHSGSEFILTQKEARRVIDLYEKVFKEFSFI